MKKVFKIILLTLFLTLLSLFIFDYYLSSKTEKPPLYFPKLFFQSLNNSKEISSKNILVLGLDPRNDTLEKTETTDTIIIVNISQSGIKLFSLPRDLWDYNLSLKINQYYPKSKLEPNQFEYIAKNIQKISGQKIDNIIVFKTSDLANIIDIIGNIEINLDSPLIDKQYPNPEYIKNPSSKTPIYITISYPQGKNLLDKNSIIPFVRSRKSSETSDNGGTDLGRIKRQQLVFDTIINKMLSTTNPKIFFKLYNYWQKSIETNLSDKEILSLAIHLLPSIKNITVSNITIPTGESIKTDILYHPNKLISGQWVYLPNDKNYNNLKQFIQSNLK